MTKLLMATIAVALATTAYAGERAVLLAYRYAPLSSTRTTAFLPCVMAQAPRIR
jgi:hypothetical protein